MSIWNGFDEADVEIHGDELDAERRAYLADMADELTDVCEDCRVRVARGDDVTEDCGACDEVRCGFAR